MIDEVCGQRIVNIRPANETEMEHEGWEGDCPPTVLVLESGTVIYPSRDAEGNGPGELFGTAYRPGEGVVGFIIGTLDPDDQKVEASALLDAIERVAPGTFAYLEQTGGGCATIFIGSPKEVNDEMYEDPQHLLAFGPGEFEDGKLSGEGIFYFGDVYLGRNDFGESEARTIVSMQDFEDSIAVLLALPDWRD